MPLGANVRKLREVRKWTLDRLSEESGVDVGTISALENRDSQRSKYVHRLARALGVTVDVLQGDEPLPPASQASAGSVGPALIGKRTLAELSPAQAKLLSIWGVLTEKQQIMLLEQIQATAASNIEIREHMEKLGIKQLAVVPDGEVAKHVKPAPSARPVPGTAKKTK